MEEYIQTLLASSTSPYLTAFLLGILINISPCPLCTNITAIGYLSKDIGNRKKILLNSFLYMLGKMLAYVVLGLVVYYTANMLSIREFFEEYGEKILGPILIFTGIFLLDIIKFHKHDEHCNHKQGFVCFPRLELCKRCIGVRNKRSDVYTAWFCFLYIEEVACVDIVTSERSTYEEACSHIKADLL